MSTDTAVALMAGYFGGVVAGRVLGSRLARRHDPARLLAPLTVGTLADATSLKAALGVVPVMLVLAAGLTLVHRGRTPASAAP